jgi:prepilin-type N-terminal cleavage/methylation domain-containing protein
MNDPTHLNRKRGFTAIELIIGVVLSSLVLTGIYRLWKSSTTESTKIQSKIDLRNQMALSTKRLNQSITVAGLGLNKVVGLQKSDAVGSDTLFVYTNDQEAKTTLETPYNHGQTYVRVVDDGIFEGARFVALTCGSVGEIRTIRETASGKIYLHSAFANDFDVACTQVMPASREMFYSDQSQKKLVRIVNLSSPAIVGNSIHNFQVSFRDRNGTQTDNLGEVKFVNYSLTGIYSVSHGDLSSIVHSSTSIPRNIF